MPPKPQPNPPKPKPCSGCGREPNLKPDAVCTGYPNAPGYNSGPIPTCVRLNPHLAKEPEQTGFAF